MNTAEFFSGIDENDVARFDPHEYVDEARQVKSISIMNDNNEWVPIRGIINPLLSNNANRPNINLFCLHAIKNTNEYFFDDRNLEFGDSAIVIYDIKEFIKRFKSAVKANGYNLYQGPVAYVSSDTHDGPMGPFRKFDQYSYQHEFRFALVGAEVKPITIEIGDIRDISFVIPAIDIPKIIVYLNANV